MIQNLRQYQLRDIWLVNEEGLIDIFIGLGLLGFALDMALDASIWFITSWMFAYFLVLSIGKEVITQPRMNHFKVDKEKLSRLNNALKRGPQLLFLCLLLGLILIIFMAYAPSTWILYIQNILWLILAGFIAGGFCWISHYDLGGKRFYFYAVVVTVEFLFQHIFNSSPIPFIFSTAALLLISGIALLVRFVIKYPISADNAHK